jgi:hypothetical protein
MVWAVVGGAFGLCLGWHLRLGLRSAWLAPYLACAILLATTALIEGFWTGQADLPLTASLSLATLAVWQWQRAPARSWLVQAAIFAAAAALAKFEGLPRVGVLVAAVLLEGALQRQPRFWRPAPPLLIAGVAAGLVWAAFELTHAIAANGEHVGPLQPLALGGVLLALLAVFGGVRTGGGVLVAALAWLVAAPALRRPPLRLLTWVVALQLLATLIAFLVSTPSPELEVRTSATRLVEQWLPVALFAAGVGLSETGHL